MATERHPANDPRTVARDIPGIFDALFPQLAPGIVAHFNRKSYAAADCGPVPAELVATSNLQRAMLFEVAVAAGEQLIAGNDPVDWDICLKVDEIISVIGAGRPKVELLELFSSMVGDRTFHMVASLR